MIGQMTYDPKSKSWKFTAINDLTENICNTANCIQSRKGYYRCRVGELTNGFENLTDAIKWVEGKN